LLNVQSAYMNFSSSTVSSYSVRDRIRRARRAAQLSQTSLARRVGVTPSAVAQWEHPQGTTPGLERLRLIASATDADFHWLVTGVGAERATSEGSAVILTTFAQDDEEEDVLEYFRALPARVKKLIGEAIRELKLAGPSRKCPRKNSNRAPR